ncbi:hypothetical protein POM88_029068 [Heracleum sosnowskyi]|uniref:AAA ATPase AAA+ lid domain-containing protein n=1 Tax=Heracleum sosnowskyi TaxID=360622 RepID=A0AAD8HT69_9APIA|nr:hypothetical protein POM88_029068 [Heracleum sosnowskyi]
MNAGAATRVVHRVIGDGVGSEGSKVRAKIVADFDLLKIARCTPGFVGADLAALANKAGNLAMKRIIDQRKSELSIEPLVEENAEEWWRRPWTPEEMEKLRITMGDFEGIIEAFATATAVGTHEQIKFLVSQRCIKPLCGLVQKIKNYSCCKK